MNLQVRVSSMRTCAHSSAEVIKFPGPRALSAAAAAGTVQQSGAEMALFCIFYFILLTFYIRMSHTPPFTIPNTHILTLTYPHAENPQPHPHSTVTILEPSHIKKLITVRKCRMTLHRDITVGVGVFLIATPTQPPHRLLSFSKNIHSASVCPHFKLRIQIWDVSLRGWLHIAIYAYSRFPFLPLPLRDAWFVDNVVMLGAMCVRVCACGLFIMQWFIVDFSDICMRNMLTCKIPDACWWRRFLKKCLSSYWITFGTHNHVRIDLVSMLKPLLNIDCIQKCAQPLWCSVVHPWSEHFDHRSLVFGKLDMISGCCILLRNLQCYGEILAKHETR